MPYNQTVTGTITIDVLFQLHLQHDYFVKEIYFLAPLPFNASGIVLDTEPRKIGSTGPIDFHCPEANHTCMQVFRVEVDTSLVQQDCMGPLRARADSALREGVVANLSRGTGYTYVPELSVPVRFSNGKPACPARDEPDYEPDLPVIAAGFNDFPWSYSRMTILRDKIPMRPIRGKWRLRQLQSFDQRQYNRITPVVAPVTRSFVTLNPRFHLLPNVIIGSVQLDKPNMIWENLEIDTTLLPNGRNILFFRSDSFIAPGTTFPDAIPWLQGVNHTFSGGKPHPGGTQSAVLAFAFFVDNPQPPRPPAPPSPEPSSGPGNSGGGNGMSM
ncbi:hypothetical protein HYH03_017658 [Edaphochlamys debaryana]|uniref:Uncharacterized protein n=1 Tax=Edaphochlamys debaryana TaxID=47281 RepID=A0A836BNP0_9CHLO|nr:hypothetical protein HYH03_017658 [Edaphochlamys debaryana]|eukprot:KAG2483476.1 hypothetical protein HYH03_017658 [Edaphochlamys debaryana]